MLLTGSANRQKALAVVNWPRACTSHPNYLVRADTLPQVRIDPHHNFGGRIHRRDSGSLQQERR